MDNLFGHVVKLQFKEAKFYDRIKRKWTHIYNIWVNNSIEILVWAKFFNHINIQPLNGLCGRIAGNRFILIKT